MNSKSVIRYFLLSVLFVVFSSNSLRAQSFAGDWYSITQIQGMWLQFNIHVVEVDGAFTGTFDVPEQGASGVPLTSISLEDNVMKFSFVQAGFEYKGTVDPAFTKIIGALEQGGQTFDMVFTKAKVEMPENSIPKIQENYNKKEVYITMRDGIKLFTSIYSPKNSDAKSPMLIMRTPYNAEAGGEENWSMFIPLYYRFIKEGYIMVMQDVRGRYMSEGEYVHVRPHNPAKKGNEIDEGSDTYDTVEWLLKNVENNNGNVGVMGISYPGFYSTTAILAFHPAIKAVSPQAPVTNWFVGDDWHHNGAFMLIDGFSFYTFFGEDHPAPSRRNTAQPFNWGTQDSYEFFNGKSIKELTNTYFPDSSSYLQTIRRHPDYDDYWKSTDPRPHLKNIMPAVMTVGGWFDAEDCWGAQKTYEAIEKQNPKANNTLVIGPWSHGQWAGADGENMGKMYWGVNANDKFHEMEVNFFNYYLKNDGEMDLPEASIFVTGDNEWCEFETWPPENIKQETWYLREKEKLSFEKSTSAEAYNEFVSDPNKPVPYTEYVHLRRPVDYMTDDQRFASKRPDVLVYETGPLSEGVTLTGSIIADLFVSTTGTDADFVVKLIDVFPNDAQTLPDQDIDMPLGGYQMLVRGEVFRGRYRKGFDKPEAFVPGKVSEVKFELPAVAHTFKKDHKIMVQVQSSWFPLVDMNPQKFVNIYECDASDFQKATHRVYNSKKFPSSITVSVLK